MQSNRPSDVQGDRLSWGDTVFLHLEREGMPLNVACVCVFEGDIAFEACVQFVESKLPLIPRYLKRLVAPPLEYWPSELGIRPHLRHPQPRTRGDAEARHRHRVEDACGKDSEHSDGPATPALGSDLCAWAERESQRTDLPPAPLPRRWHRGRGDHECVDGCEPRGASSAQTKASAACPAAS